MEKVWNLSATDERQLTQQLEQIRRGTVEIVPEEALISKLRRSIATKTPLRLKLGMDPSSPDVHLGHTVVLSKIREMQDMGHVVDLVIGDFTGRIGDPTGKSETRRQLTADEVTRNAETYVEQVFKVLNPSKTNIVRNADWLASLTFEDVIRLASSVTVARMLERDDFSKRFTESRPIHIHEFFYPLMQAYDSVHLRTDIEFGGTDQTFNLLMGRTLQKEYGQEEQTIITMPLLEGLDGVQKMSKSLGNYIGVNDHADDIWGKVMSIPDQLMPRYYTLLSGISELERSDLLEGLRSGRVHPRDAKLRLAHELTARFAGTEAAEHAKEHWVTVFQTGSLPDNIPEVNITSGAVWVVRALVHLGLASSNSEARRMIEQGGLKVDGVKVEDPQAELQLRDGMVIQVGKRKFVRCRV